MAQIPTATYKLLADAYHASRSSIVGADQYAEDALDVVVDITSATPGATELELALLTPCNNAKTYVTSLVGSITGYVSAVRAINNYVINNSTATATQIGVYGSKLSVFVKLDMDTVWDNGCVPWYWEELSRLAGFDTGGWKICPSA